MAERPVVAAGTIPLDALPGAVVVVDAQRRVVEANAALSRLIGYRPADVVGRSARRVLDPTDLAGRPLWASGWHPSTRLRGVRRVAAQTVYLRSGEGTRIPVRVTGTYQRDEAGAVTGAVICLERYDAGEPSDRSIEIVSTVSHELRSPLTSVKGYTTLLLHRWDRLRDDQKRMMLEAVHHDAERVTRLVTELLDISRLETGRLVLRRQLVDLATLATSVVERVRASYPDLEATVAFAENVPRVSADPDKIEQVLTNLVENACKYGSPVGVRIGGSVRGAEVAVVVRDQGEGISAEDLPRVFTRFFRRSEQRPSGSGLGLWISRGLVESHGGHLSAESKPPGGAAFCFTLPLFEES